MSAEAELWHRAAANVGGSNQRARYVLSVAVDGGVEPHSAQPLPAIDEECPLTDALLSLVAWGLIFSATAGFLAGEAIKSGANTAKIKRLASIGAHGDHAGNCRRDLLRRFFHNLSIPKPLMLKVLYLDRAKEIFYDSLSILSPFDFIQFVWDKHRNIFFDVFGRNPRSFWDQVSPDDPRLAWLPDHIISRSDWKDHTWPIILHGDSAPYNKKGAASLISLQ